MQSPLIPERIEWSRSPALPAVRIPRAGNCGRRSVEDAGFVLPRSPLKVKQHSDAVLFRELVAFQIALKRFLTTLDHQCCFRSCLGLLLSQCAEMRPPPVLLCAEDPSVHKARVFIHEHLAEQIGLEELAAACGDISRFHLAHIFTARVGRPPHTYQIQLRILLARVLLTAGIPSAGIAINLGFSDQSHFGRHFRQVVGVTPAAYARATDSLCPLESALSCRA